MKKKIFFITNDLGLGGVQRLVVDFANHLDKSKFDVWVVTLLSGPESFFYQDILRSDAHFINFSFNGFWDLWKWWRLYDFIKKQKPDVVFTQLFMADTIGRLLAFLARTPLIITEIQNIIPGLPKRFVFVNRLLRYITDICISTTTVITNYAIDVVGFSPEKIVEIPTNVVDANRFNVVIDRKKIRETIGIPKDAKLVINIGRLITQKGQEVLIRAAQEIVMQDPSIFFVIVGSGRLEEKLKNEAQLLGVAEKIKFLGARKDTPDLLMSSDLFVFPSLWEGQGLILFEAIFARIPIVASDVGGIPDVIEHEVTGLLSPPKDHQALAANIIRIFKNPEFAKTISTTAYERYQDRTIKNTVQKLETLFVTRI